MAKAKASFEVAVGFFVVVGFLILSMIVFFVSGTYFFRPGYHLSTIFDYVGIINRGAPVRFSGVRVGEITEVKLLPPEGDTGKAQVQLVYFLEKNVEVREKYIIGIRGTHIMSEPHIEISAVPSAGRVLKDGDMTLPGLSPLSMDDLIKQGQEIAERLNRILGGASGIFENPETMTRLGESFNDMHAILASMNKIMNGQEDQFRQMVVNLNRVSDEAGTMLENINEGNGTIGQLVSNDELYREMRDFVREIKTHPWKLLKKK